MPLSRGMTFEPRSAEKRAPCVNVRSRPTAMAAWHRWLHGLRASAISAICLISIIDSKYHGQSQGALPCRFSQSTIGRAIPGGLGDAPRSLAQAALELPAVAGENDGNNVEIKAFVALVRIFV